MYSIIIKGKKQSGKSTTIREVCRSLKPTKVRNLNFNQRRIEDADVPIGNISNGTYLLEVKGRIVLVIAGAPTEQQIRVTEIYEICVELQISISFIISAMRFFETKPTFHTIQEIEQISTLLHIFNINRIERKDFEESTELLNRISEIRNMLTEKLFKQ